MADTTPLMPDGIAASKRSQPAPLPPLSLPPTPGGPPAPLPPPPAMAPPPTAAMPPTQPPGAMPIPPGAPMGQPLAAPQPTIHDLIPGIQSTIQDNGKILITAPPLTPGGAPQVIDVLDAPKVPKALQPPKPKTGP